MMIRTDGSIRPCCNSNRTLNSFRDIDIDTIWNSDESVHLREEMLSGELDKDCTVCKSRNVDPPEEIISKVYTEHAIFCENVPYAAQDDEATPPQFREDVPTWDDGRLLRMGNRRHPLISNQVRQLLGIVGHVDECSVKGHVLRCRGWAFDRSLERVPSQYAIFADHTFLGMSGPCGERYDVAKALSSSLAVRSGYFFRVELETDSCVHENSDIQVVALFLGSPALLPPGRGDRVGGRWKRLLQSATVSAIFRNGFGFRMSINRNVRDD